MLRKRNPFGPKRREAIKPSVRVRVLYRDRYTCQYCGASAPDVRLVVDHIIPVARGGGNDERNLTTACYECNAGKYAQMIVPLARLLEWEDVDERAAEDAADMALPTLQGERLGTIIPRVVGAYAEPLPDPAVVAWLNEHCGRAPAWSM